jgi:hypothetical protein
MLPATFRAILTRRLVIDHHDHQELQAQELKADE